jgi:glycosyltransferase involved in cell wall biosynthesis
MSRAADGPGRVAILGIDTFARKNRAQVEGMNARGYAFDVFTNDLLGDSAENLLPGNRLEWLRPGAAARARQVAAYLRAHRGVLNHVEVYPGGRFAGAYVALARLFRVPVMVVERGDLLYFDRYGPLTRASMSFCYRGAHAVWYRELYQGERLRKMRIAQTFFLSNAVARAEHVPPPEARTLDFLWVNRLIVERRADWVADILARPRFTRTRVVIQGFLDSELASAAVRQRQDYVLSKGLAHLEVGNYGNPEHLYRAARFFLLPSEVVFCNNALLEAMAHGVVPLVSDVEGARMIVTDGVDGFVHPHSREGLAGAMERALALPPDAYAHMSRAARETVAARFSLDRWCDALEDQYGRLAAGAPPAELPDLA